MGFAPRTASRVTLCSPTPPPKRWWLAARSSWVEIFGHGGWSTGKYNATLENSYELAVALVESREKTYPEVAKGGYLIMIRSDKTAEIKLSHQVDSLKELEELDIEVRSDRVELVLEKN